MNGFLSSAASLIIGVITTILVSNYFYKRTFKSSLTPFIQFSSAPLRGIDQNVRNELFIKYKEHEVKNLFEIQFLISNTGDKAIKNLIEPLKISIPDDTELLDATILYVNPTGRKIDINISLDKKSVNFNFPLLNSGEFFITKLFINGIPKEQDIKFSIIAEELPPSLETKALPLDALDIGNRKKIRFEWPLLFIGFFFLMFSISMFNLIFNNWSTLPPFSGIFNFISSLNFDDLTLFIIIIPTFLFFIIGVFLIIVCFITDFPSLRNKNKFIVPNNVELLRSGNHFTYYSK